MQKAERIFSFVIALLCLGYLFFVWKMDELGSVNEPGAAFFPAVLGMLGLATSLKLLLTSMLVSEDPMLVTRVRSLAWLISQKGFSLPLSECSQERIRQISDLP